MQWLIDLVLESIRAGVHQLTDDGADIVHTYFASGGAASIDRGAYIDLYGNEHPDHPGVAALFGEGNVGINTFSPLFTFSIASADGSQQVGFSHDNSHAHFHTTLGRFNFETSEGTNTNTFVEVKGKGTGAGTLNLYDEDDHEYFNLYCRSGIGGFRIIGDNPVSLDFAAPADHYVRFFARSTEGDIQPIELSGWRTGDAAKRTLSQGISPDAHDTALWSGVAHYVFDGNLRATGAVIGGSITHSAVGPTDNLNVSGVNTVFLDCSANNITIGGLLGGVDGQVVHFAKTCDSAFDVTLEHVEGTGNQDLHLHAGIDETLKNEYGGWTLACKNGQWYDISHAKHV